MAQIWDTRLCPEGDRWMCMLASVHKPSKARVLQQLLDKMPPPSTGFGSHLHVLGATQQLWEKRHSSPNLHSPFFWKSKQTPLPLPPLLLPPPSGQSRAKWSPPQLKQPLLPLPPLLLPPSGQSRAKWSPPQLKQPLLPLPPPRLPPSGQSRTKWSP